MVSTGLGIPSPFLPRGCLPHLPFVPALPEAAFPRTSFALHHATPSPAGSNLPQLSAQSSVLGFRAPKPPGSLRTVVSGGVGSGGVGHRREIPPHTDPHPRQALPGPTVRPRLPSLTSSITSVSPDGQEAAFIPFDRWGPQGPERLPRVTQVVIRGQAGMGPELRARRKVLLRQNPESSLEATFHEPHGQ